MHVLQTRLVHMRVTVFDTAPMFVCVFVFDVAVAVRGVRVRMRDIAMRVHMHMGLVM